jgi:hypothetical protein
MVLPICNLDTRKGWVVNTTPPLLYHLAKAPVPIAQEAGWVLGLVWMDPENLASTGIQT